ncbi:MAG: hypothetical protein WCT49_01240 [Candidatus Paceibacterota bacterium]|jgi:hypothetical protein|nr:hypothetical protein [Candidatus Paceibacterota bacterium]
MEEINQDLDEIRRRLEGKIERRIAALRGQAESDPSLALSGLSGAKKTESAGISAAALETASGEEFHELYLAFQNASYDLSFSSFLEYLDAFSKNENEEVSVKYANNFFILLKNALSRVRPTDEEARFFADILPRFIRSYQRPDSFDQASLSTGLCNVFREHSELTEVIPSILRECFLGKKFGPKEIEIMSFSDDVESVSRMMSDALSSDRSWRGTFFIDDMFAALSGSIDRAKAGREAEENSSLLEKEVSSVSDLLVTIEHLLPEILARGQGVLLKKGLTIFLSAHPEFEKTAEKLIEETREISISEKGDERMEIISDNEKERLFGNLDFLGDLLLDIPEGDREKFLERLRTEMEPWHAKILKQLFRSSTAISEKLAPLRPIDVSQTVHLPIVSELIGIAVKNIEKHRFHIGMLLSMIPFSELPPETRVALRPVVSSFEQTIKPGHTGWYLCPEAEPLLVESLANDAVVLVNDSILVKMAGKLSGLCVKNYKTKDGFVFIEGGWYSPSDADSRRIVREANDRGDARVEVAGGAWSLMRSVEDSPDKSSDLLLAVAKEYSSKLGTALPDTIEGLSRKEFREKKIEKE